MKFVKDGSLKKTFAPAGLRRSQDFFKEESYGRGSDTSPPPLSKQKIRAGAFRSSGANLSNVT